MKPALDTTLLPIDLGENIQIEPLISNHSFLNQISCCFTRNIKSEGNQCVIYYTVLLYVGNVFVKIREDKCKKETTFYKFILPQINKT